MRVKILQNFIDILRGKKKIPRSIEYEIKHVQKNINKLKKKLAKKIKNGEKIRVGFFVIFDSVFQTEPVFKKMLDDDMFEPFIVVIPDIARGDDNMFKQMNKTYKSFSSKYKQVYKSYDETEHKFIDFTKDTDIAFFNNPYDGMTYKFYGIAYNALHNVLTLYSSYSVLLTRYSVKHIISQKSMDYCWKIFADNQWHLNKIKEHSFLKGSNAVLTGCCKMDAISKAEKKERTRKKIIIAPHHSVNANGLGIANFLNYSEFFLELPKKYPEIDFVFRPHPLLFVTLSKSEFWGKEKVKQYLDKMCENSNVEYQDGGSYFDTFVNSDGIIHDCCSFLLEYLYTDNPCCYILANKNNESDIFEEIGQDALKHYYKSYSEQDIIDFIDNIIIKGNDTKKDERTKFANEVLKINYPNVSEKIIDYIKKELA